MPTRGGSRGSSVASPPLSVSLILTSRTLAMLCAMSAATAKSARQA